MGKLNSSADTKTLAAWLPVVVKAMKGKNLPVKSDNKAVYVSAGTNSQYAITPTTETSGKYEVQAKEGGKVVVKSSGEYSSIEDLVAKVTAKTKENSSRNQTAKTVLVAGRNLRKALQSEKLNSSRTTKKKAGERNHRLSDLNSSRTLRQSSKSRVGLNSSKEPMKLTASTLADNDMQTAISAVTGEAQTVPAVIFNTTCPVSGQTCLAIAFYDDVEGCYVKNILSGDGAGAEGFSSLEELVSSINPQGAEFDETIEFPNEVVLDAEPPSTYVEEDFYE